ncbi:STAS domain-containing protein [Mycolicibacterium hodleri]|uniref:STAS domain-containing protein n=1 Tax=Mycolicibacterium hodleri TaxID=49897 RepID=A0A502DV43_9MYCO|nr:STAS domain-containing protein [Mycolicibacterium hodleri]TPG28096.1 hypothetical protein EAH80_28630 [Mycolicibacterium hodleri]
MVNVTGELLSQTAANLTLLITDELRRYPPQVMIDVSAVTVIDLPGANALLLATGMAAASEVPLYLHGARSGPVESVLKNLDLLDLFESR